MSPKLADRDPPLGLLFGDVEEETYDDDEASKLLGDVEEETYDVDEASKLTLFDWLPPPPGPPSTKSPSASSKPASTTSKPAEGPEDPPL